MAKKMLIDATHAEETRVVVVDGTKVEEFDFETLNKRQLAGNIYLAKVTRVEPSLQAAFVDYGGNRHGFLAFAEIHPDYYQIPAADRRAIIEEDRAAAEAAEAEESDRERRGSRRRSGERAERAGRREGDAVTQSAEVRNEAAAADSVPGMEIADPATDEDDAAIESGFAASGGDVVDPTVEEQGGGAGAGGPSPQGERLQDREARADAPAEAAEPDGREEAADDAEADERADGAAPEPTAADKDSEIESIAEEDVADEIRPARKPRARRYKIQEVIRVRQIMLVQVVKEERGNKGAALTTYLSLPGRYCVLMPNTSRGGGISRKITNAADRKKLKEIASELEVPQGAGLIIRTAGSQRTRTEIKRDYEYLMRLWEQIRELTFRSIAPAAIYEEGDLIKRTIRDLYSKDIDEVIVEGERGYRTARDFMAMIMPSHARNVKQYTDPMPLFARYQVEGYLGGMFNPVVQLKSGGYIVIGITEALVAIDVNSGRATKEGSIEDTAFKTNCEAADEIARQLRLRDLAGLIVIDFIDMDERKNNAAVEKRFKERLQTDRARIQVGRISGFGLMEMSRQRLRPGMLESTTQPCPHCHGTGLIRSDDSMALTILRAIEEEGTRKRSREVLVKAPVAVANFLMNHKREHVGMIETRYGMAVRVEADPSLISPDFALEKFKTATRTVVELPSPVLSVDASLMAQIDDEEELFDDPEDEAAAQEPAATERDEDAAADGGASDAESEGRGKRRRRRRRRGGARSDEGNAPEADAAEVGEAAGADADSEDIADAGAEAGSGEDAAGAPTPRRDRSRSRSRSRRRIAGGDDAAEASASDRAVIDESRQVPAGEGEIPDVGGSPANADGLVADEGPAAASETDAEVLPLAETLKGEGLGSDDQSPQQGEAAGSEVDGRPEAEPEQADGAEPILPAGEPDLPEEPVANDGATAESVAGEGAQFAPGNEDAGEHASPQEPREPQEAQEAAAAAELMPVPAAEPPAPARPKRRGWWSQG